MRIRLVEIIASRDRNSIRSTLHAAAIILRRTSTRTISRAMRVTGS